MYVYANKNYSFEFFDYKFYETRCAIESNDYADNFVLREKLVYKRKNLSEFYFYKVSRKVVRIESTPIIKNFKVYMYIYSSYVSISICFPKSTILFA